MRHAAAVEAIEPSNAWLVRVVEVMFLSLSYPVCIHILNKWTNQTGSIIPDRICRTCTRGKCDTCPISRCESDVSVWIDESCANLKHGYHATKDEAGCDLHGLHIIGWVILKMTTVSRQWWSSTVYGELTDLVLDLFALCLVFSR